MHLALLLLACSSGEAPSALIDTGAPRDQPEPVIRLGPDVLDFGLVIAGSTTERVLSVRNEGPGTAVLNVRLDVAIPQAFTFAPDRFEVAPNENENVTFVFYPEAWALFDGEVVFSTDTAVVAIADIAAEVQADRDNDGYGEVRHGGTDCDDSDPSIHPDAVDDWYDGVDADCDGWSDFDADRDGYDASGGDTVLDCDDTDPSRSPGLAEVWYDGIDTDCDGLSDYDQDADGDDAAEFGGGDCVDTDAHLSSLPSGYGCLAGDVQLADRSHAIVGVHHDAQVRDLTGDGYSDLVLASADAGVFFVHGPVTADLMTPVAPTWRGHGGNQLSLADHTGDSIVDALLFEPQSGALRAIVGPLSAGGSISMDGTKYPTAGRSQLGLKVAHVDDIDGDGVIDFAVGWSGDSARPSTLPRVAVHTSPDAFPDHFVWGEAGSRLGAAVLGPGDLDGDGYADLLVGDPSGDGRVYRLAGPLSGDIVVADSPARLTGDPMAELGSALTVIDGNVWVRSGSGWSEADGDWDGTLSITGGTVAAEPGTDLSPASLDTEPAPDMVLTQRDQDAVFWMPVPSGPASTGTAPLTIRGAGAIAAGGRVATGDLDGDGWNDILVTAPSDSAARWLPGPVAN